MYKGLPFFQNAKKKSKPLLILISFYIGMMMLAFNKSGAGFGGHGGDGLDNFLL